MSRNKLNVKNADTLHALLEIALQQFENKDSSTGSNVLQAMVGMQVISTLDSLEVGWRSMSEKIEMAAAEKIKQLSVENQQLKEELELFNANNRFNPIDKNPVYVAPDNQAANEWAKNNIGHSKQNIDEWAYHDPDLKVALYKIRTAIKSDNIKTYGVSAERAIKNLCDSFSKGIKTKQDGDGVLFAMIGAEVVKTLDSTCSGWRKQGQDIRKSAVDKINQMALAIDMCDLEKHSGEYQAAHRYMNAIFTKLNSHDVDVKTYRQCASVIDNLLFERQSLIEKSHCFDELQAVLRKANPDSFESEQPRSLLDDCKHAIKELSAYKSEYMQRAHK